MENLLFNIVNVENVGGFKFFIKIEENDSFDVENHSDSDNKEYEDELLDALISNFDEESVTKISSNAFYFYDESGIYDDENLDDLKKTFVPILQKLTNLPVALDETLNIDDKLEVYYELFHNPDNELVMMFSPKAYVDENGGLQDSTDILIANVLNAYGLFEEQESIFAYNKYTLDADLEMVEIPLEEQHTMESFPKLLEKDECIHFIPHTFNFGGED